MSYEKIRKVVRVLREKTSFGKVTWEETENEGIFQATFTNYTVKIYEETNERGESLYWLQIYNAEGKLVDAVNDESLQDSSFEDAFFTMKDLYETARRSAMGIEQALDEILFSLKDKPPF